MLCNGDSKMTDEAGDCLHLLEADHALIQETIQKLTAEETDGKYCCFICNYLTSTVIDFLVDLNMKYRKFVKTEVFERNGNHVHAGSGRYSIFQHSLAKAQYKWTIDSSST